MATITVWKKELALHCPNCDNVLDLIFLDGRDVLGECMCRCPECLTEFVATAKLFKTPRAQHGTLGAELDMGESLNAKARREARE